MYNLTIEIYKNKFKSIKEYDSFKDALLSAEFISKILNNALILTRHSSCQSLIQHCDYYADLYNELAIIVKNKNKK